MALIDLIADPARADIPQALRERQQFADVSRQNQARDIAGQVLGETFAGKLGALARLDPEGALQLSKVLGVPADSKGRLDNLIGVTIQAEKLLANGLIPEAIQLLDESATNIERFEGPQSAQRLRITQQALMTGDQEIIGNFRKFAQTVTPLVQQKPLTEGQITKAGQVVTLGPGGPVARDIAGFRRGGPGQNPPREVLKGLSTPERKRATEAFNLAGGGKDGLEALNAQVKLDKATLKRDQVPQMLSDSFPQANPVEMEQLRAAVDGAKTIESGLKRADKLRAEQKRLSDGAVFQKRALDLLDKILANPELNDVLGSIEGDEDSFVGGFIPRSDAESEVIADIEEATSILTADNLKLMSGVLSESDIKLLRQLSSGALDRRRGEARFIRDVTKMRAALSSKIAQRVGGDQTSLGGQQGQQNVVLRFDAQGNPI